MVSPKTFGGSWNLSRWAMPDPLGLIALWMGIILFGAIGIVIVALPVLLWNLRK